jgi:hypothetical protein
MPSVFEQPWLLLILALVAFLVVGTWRAVVPEKNRWWQWCIPLGLALLGLGLDAAVATDHEQVTALSRNLIKTVAAEDIEGLDRLIAADYRDSLHRDREALLRHVTSGLSHSPVSKITKISGGIESLGSTQASVTMETIVLFAKESRIASIYRAQVFVNLRLRMAKSPGGAWLLERIDLLEVDRQPMNWGQIPGEAF